MYGIARHAQGYDRVAGRLARPLYRRVVADVLAAGLPVGAAVLDVGTGPGRVPLMIATGRPDLRVEGIDLAPEMIEVATRRGAAAGIAEQRLRFTVADVATLPHPDASVDLVVSTLSLHHWADVPAGLVEIGRVLRPGGRAWIYDVHRVLEPAARALAETGGVDVELGRLTGGGLLGRLAGRLVGRLIVTR
jgi:ubiquinone/menaquinone biosynthesis C-methylase UbiE